MSSVLRSQRAGFVPQDLQEVFQNWVNRALDAL